MRNFVSFSPFQIDMVVPIFISTQYKEAKDLDGNFGAADEVEHIDNPSFECDESVEVEPRWLFGFFIVHPVKWCINIP